MTLEPCTYLSENQPRANVRVASPFPNRHSLHEATVKQVRIVLSNFSLLTLRVIAVANARCLRNHFIPAGRSQPGDDRHLHRRDKSRVATFMLMRPSLTRIRFLPPPSNIRVHANDALEDRSRVVRLSLRKTDPISLSHTPHVSRVSRNRLSRCAIAPTT